MNIPNKWSELKEGYPTKIEVPVHWGDMDAAKHVNNSIYLKWGETARIGYFQKMKMDTTFGGGTAGPILGYQDCKYIYPITFPDQALIACRTKEILADRFVMECLVYSKSKDRLAAISTQTILAYSYVELKKVALPVAWVEAIKKLEHL